MYKHNYDVISLNFRRLHLKDSCIHVYDYLRCFMLKLQDYTKKIHVYMYKQIEDVLSLKFLLLD